MPFAGRLLWPKQLAAIRDIATLAMVEEVDIFRRSDAPAPSPTSDYGDDALSFIETTETRRGHVKGWVTSTPTPTQVVDEGAVVTANTYILQVPVGTDILPGDRVLINSNDYTVTDTTQENTWVPYLKCSMRRRE
jgi:hypothetical protein